MEISITKKDLQDKVERLDSWIENTESQISKLKIQRDHLSYLLNNFEMIATAERNESERQTGLFPIEATYDRKKSTKELLIEIMRDEARKMKWREVYEIFHKVKPEIAETTVRVSLSQMNASKNYPVSMIKNGQDYVYVYKEKV